MNKIEKMANNILCESLRKKISIVIPKEFELKLDKEGIVDTGNQTFKQLEDIIDKLENGIDLSDLMSKDGFTEEPSVNVLINFAAYPTGVKEVQSIAEEIVEKFDMSKILSPDERSDVYGTIDLKSSGHIYDPVNNVGHFKLEWLPSGELYSTPS